MSEQGYGGEELHLFAAVRNWKDYWSRAIREYISGDVLEVGAGIGSNTEFMNSARVNGWVCLEPDPRLLDQLRHRLKRSGYRKVETVSGTLRTIGVTELFDTIIYIDVLEHIEDDRGELDLAVSHLRPGGHLIVLSPAHQWLFTPFDGAIGHFRRYNRKMLRSITSSQLAIEKLAYLDAVGLLASAANRFFLRQSMPTEAQLQFWDRRIIPISRILDPLLHYSVGKSILAVWRRLD